MRAAEPIFHELYMGGVEAALKIAKHQGHSIVARKEVSPAQRIEIDAETEQIKKNRETVGYGPHPFKDAKWTHPNGHPRCLLCGDEERLPDGFDTTDVPTDKWPTAECEGWGARKGSKAAGDPTDISQRLAQQAALDKARLVNEWWSSIQETTQKQLGDLLNLLPGGAAADALGEAAAIGLGEIMDGVAMLFGPERAERIAVTECLVPETMVDGAMVRTAFRRWYEGEIVEVVTNSGRRISATPNHPVLTGRGWLGVGEITERDYLICDARKKDVSAARPGDPDVEAPPTTIGEIFDSLAAVGLAERVATTEPDFHGDGREGNIDVLSPDGVLRIGSFAPLYEPVVNQFLTPSDTVRAAFCTRCRRLLSITEQGCLCGVPQLHSGGTEPVRYQRPVYSQRRGDSRDGLAVAVAGEDLVGRDLVPESVPMERDFIRAISRRNYVGHVHNLSTPYGYFTIGGGVFSGNTTRVMGQAAIATYDVLGIQEWEWRTAEDDRVCVLCEAARDGGPYQIDEPFEIIHTHDRCWPVPLPPGMKEWAEKEAQHTGAMVALFPSPALAKKLAIAGGEPASDLHVTLAFLGEAADIDGEAVLKAVKRVVRDFGPLTGEVSGVGRFSIPDGDAFYASVDLPGGVRFRQALVEELDRANVFVADNHGWTPHLTLAYLEQEDAAPLDRMDTQPVTFDSVVVALGDERTNVMFGAKEVGLKFNDNHDVRGRFASGDGGGAFATLAANYRRILRYIARERKVPGGAYKFTGDVTVSRNTAYGTMVAAIGRDLTDEQIARVAGAPDGSEISVQTNVAEGNNLLSGGDAARVRIEVRNEALGLVQDRVISRATDGTLGMYNDYFRVRQDRDTEGLGIRALAREVSECRALGIKEIKTYAAGHAGDSMNGYYTWPRMGFDADLPIWALPVTHEPGSFMDDLHKGNELPAGHEDDKRLSDLMRDEVGRAYWKEHGAPIEVTLDVNGPGGARFDEYAKAKGVTA